MSVYIIVNFLASVNEVKSCQIYLATQDCSNEVILVNQGTCQSHSLNRSEWIYTLDTISACSHWDVSDTLLQQFALAMALKDRLFHLGTHVWSGELSTQVQYRKDHCLIGEWWGGTGSLVWYIVHLADVIELVDIGNLRMWGMHKALWLPFW